MESNLNVQNYILWHKSAAHHDSYYILQAAIEFHQKKQTLPQDQWDTYRRYCLVPLKLMEEKYGVTLIENPTDKSVRAIDELIQLALRAQQNAKQKAASPTPPPAPAIMSMSFPDISDANKWLEAHQNIDIVAVNFSKPSASFDVLPVNIKYVINQANNYIFGFSAFEKTAFFVSANHEKLLGKWEKEHPDKEIVEHAVFSNVRAWDEVSMIAGVGNRMETNTFVILHRSPKVATAPTLKQPKHCPSCNTALSENSSFCPQCGKKVN